MASTRNQRSASARWHTATKRVHAPRSIRSGDTERQSTEPPFADA
jgi:hypothetical protein